MKWLWLFMLAGPAMAQDIDFERLFEQNAHRVETPSPGVEVLDLPGPVIVTCRNGACKGEDQSAHGAAGCALSVVTRLGVVADLCPDLLPQDAKRRLDQSVDSAWRFWAENTVPSRSPMERNAARTKRAAEIRTQLAEQCPIDGSAHGEGQRQMLLALSRETQAGRMARVFETPRLPVMTPCL